MTEPRYYTDVPRTILWLVPGAEGGNSVIEPFYLGKFPVTNEQFEAFDPGFERHADSAGDASPALGLSWADADEYCHWYAEVSRKPMRLPTEGEWEHACRGGADPAHRWFWGDDPEAGHGHAWDAESWRAVNGAAEATKAGTAARRLPPLDAKAANGFGLFGMLGGVWEWVALGSDDDGPQRVLKGGSYLTPRREATCAGRRVETADGAISDAGFRVARSLRMTG